MKIDFYHPNPTVLEHFPPVPAKKLVPDWYKNLSSLTDYTPQEATIKGCVPVQDMITSGYIIRNAYEIELKHELVPATGNQFNAFRCNYTGALRHHRFEQYPDHPTSSCNRKDYFKFRHEWVIKTPPGYSCLFIQPFYHHETNYTLLPAIVDTDKHDASIQFPGILHDSASEGIVIKPGEPIMQVIPFKRDDWKMETHELKHKQSYLDFYLSQPLAKLYKKFFHSKKNFN